ncbi:ABC-type hemin transport system ATPase subunit [Balamuthia mandrillaris]
MKGGREGLRSTSSGRNFRANYLSTLGFQGAQLKNSLEQIFKEPVIELSQLRTICRRFDLIPQEYRALVWKVLLGALPIHREAWEFVNQEHAQEYQDIKRFALLLHRTCLPPSFLRVLDELVPPPSEEESELLLAETSKGSSPSAQEKKDFRARNLALVFRVQQSLLENAYATEKDEDTAKDLFCIANVFCTVCGAQQSEAEVYWCFSHFLRLRQQTYGHQSIGIYHQINTLSRLLEKYEPEVWKHFHQLNVMVDQFSYSWFRSYFSCCFSGLYLERIWDKVIGMSVDYLACVACSLLSSLKPKILDVDHTRELTMFQSWMQRPSFHEQPPSTPHISDSSRRIESGVARRVGDHCLWSFSFVVSFGEKHRLATSSVFGEQTGCRPAIETLEDIPSYIEQCNRFTGFSCSNFDTDDNRMTAWDWYLMSDPCEPTHGFLYSVSSPWCVCLPGWGGTGCQRERRMEYCESDGLYVGGCVEVFYELDCRLISASTEECPGTNMCTLSNYCPRPTSSLDPNECYGLHCLLNDPSCSPSSDLFYCSDGTCAAEASQCEYLAPPIVAPISMVFNRDQAEELNVPLLTYDKGEFAGALKLPAGTFEKNTIIRVRPMSFAAAEEDGEGDGDQPYWNPTYFQDEYFLVSIISVPISVDATGEQDGGELEESEFYQPVEIYFQASRDVQAEETVCVGYYDEATNAWACFGETQLTSGVNTSPQVYRATTPHFTAFALLLLERYVIDGSGEDESSTNHADGDDPSSDDESGEFSSESEEGEGDDGDGDGDGDDGASQASSSGEKASSAAALLSICHPLY